MPLYLSRDLSYPRSPPHKVRVFASIACVSITGKSYRLLDSISAIPNNDKTPNLLAFCKCIVDLSLFVLYSVCICSSGQARLQFFRTSAQPSPHLLIACMQSICTIHPFLQTDPRSFTYPPLFLQHLCTCSCTEMLPSASSLPTVHAFPLPSTRLHPRDIAYSPYSALALGRLRPPACCFCSPCFPPLMQT